MRSRRRDNVRADAVARHVACARQLWQIDMDPRVVDTSHKRENSNAFTTDLGVVLPLWSLMHLAPRGRFTNVHYETSRQDNRKYLGSVAFARELSEHSTLSLNYSFMRTDYRPPMSGGNGIQPGHADPMCQRAIALRQQPLWVTQLAGPLRARGLG